MTLQVRIPVSNFSGKPLDKLLAALDGYTSITSTSPGAARVASVHFNGDEAAASFNGFAKRVHFPIPFKITGIGSKLSIDSLEFKALSTFLKKCQKNIGHVELTEVTIDAEAKKNLESILGEKIRFSSDVTTVVKSADPRVSASPSPESTLPKPRRADNEENETFTKIGNNDL